MFKGVSLVKTCPLVLCVLLALSFSIAYGEGPDDPRIPGVGVSTVFEGLRAKALLNTQGYAFSISPDENWIVTASAYPAGVINLFYIPSLGKLTYQADPEDIFKGWFPNCFSQDSSKFYFGKLVAPLDPGMSAINLQEMNDPPRSGSFENYFLGSRKQYKNKEGAVVDSWYRLGQDEGEFGESDWSFDGSTLYKTSCEGNKTYLIAGDTKNEIDFSAAVKFFVDERKAAVSDFSAMAKDSPNASDKDLSSLIADLTPDPSKLEIILDELSVSPDGKFIACVATVYEGSSRSGGASYGVIIPLGERPLAAHPFSKNVYHKIIWSRDSKRIYYYAQAVPGGGNGTVYKLELGI